MGGVLRSLNILSWAFSINRWFLDPWDCTADLLPSTQRDPTEASARKGSVLLSEHSQIQFWLLESFQGLKLL